MSLPSRSKMSPQMAIPSTGLPVRFELTEQTRQAVDTYLKTAGKKPGEFLFTGPRGLGMTTRQYARLLSGWIANIGLDPYLFGTFDETNKSNADLPPDWQPACGSAFARPHEN
jgi:hypothetical protein